MSNDFLKTMKDVVGGDYASLADEGVVGEVSKFIDMGSYALNALVSGSIYGGFPANKIIMLAGEPAVGKTFFALAMVADFMRKNPDGQVVMFESEGAITNDTFSSRGIDRSRVLVVPVVTVQEFRTAALRVLQAYEAIPAKKRPPMLMVLDSLGMLSTAKEIADAAEGKDTRDMTRAQLIRGAFRVLSLKMGVLNVPLIVTNHVSEVIGAYVPTKTTTGGMGANYGASTVVMLTKSRDKDGTAIIGNIIKVTLAKSRFTREGLRVETKLSYEDGLLPYHGLVEMAVEAGVWKKEGSYVMVEGKKLFPSQIYKNPEPYFTKEVMDGIDEYTRSHYMFGMDKRVNQVDLDEDGENGATDA